MRPAGLQLGILQGHRDGRGHLVRPHVTPASAEDGTLMDSRHTLPQAHRLALQSCLRRGVPVVLATGKHRGPWLGRLTATLGMETSSGWTLNAPGVFVQGLLVCDARGQVTQARLLEPALCRACSQVAALHHWTLLAYTAPWPSFHPDVPPARTRMPFGAARPMLRSCLQ